MMKFLNPILINVLACFAVNQKESRGEPQDSSSSQTSKCNNRPAFSSVPVVTKHGTYEGKQSTLEGSHLMTLCPVAQFLGIPYAQPPTNERRWQKPFSLNIDDNAKSNNKIEAKEMGPVCPQNLKAQSDDALKPGWYEDAKRYMSRQSERKMSEDCLYLNIYAPMDLYINDTGISHKYKARLPVMVYFHGHTFMEGSGNFYDGSVLASFGNVIVVTFNYRIGVLGFLSFLSGDYLGNYGLWDQLEALKWVRQNIEDFGGDSKRVTAFGSGSGAISIHLLMMTHHADDTFNRAILQSGSALSPMALVNLPTSQAQLIAQRLNCSAGMQTPKKDIMRCLRLVQCSDLVNASRKQEKYKVNFGPVIDGEFVQGPPKETMKNNDYMSYQIIVGISQNDGYGYFKQSDGDVFTESPLDPSSTRTERSFLIAVDRFVDAFYNRTKSRDGVDITDVMRKMIDYVYRDSKTKLTPLSAMTSVLDMYTDSQWLTPTIETAQVNSKLDQPTYFYTFGYKPDQKRKKPSWITAAHGDELPFVFGYPFKGMEESLFQYTFTDRDGEVSIKVMEYWTNFAKTGNPMGESGSSSRGRLSNWPRYDENKRIGLYISYSNLNTVSQYRHKKYQFWNSLVPRLQVCDCFPQPASQQPRSIFLQDLFRFKRKSNYYGISSVRDVSKNTPVTKNPWSETRDGTMVEYPQAEPGGGGRKSESGMSLQLTITLAIGFVLIFANIIAFSIVSYHKRKDKYKIKKLRSELEERKRLLENDLRRCGITNPCSSSPDDITLNENRDYKVIEKPLDGATTWSIASRAATDSAIPVQCPSNVTLSLIKQCAGRDDTPSTSGSQQTQSQIARNNIMQADVNSSLDESPVNVMASRGQLGSVHSNVIIRRAQPNAMKREVASLDGNYDYHTPDYKFKTYSARASCAGPFSFPESRGHPATVKKQTSLWSLTSVAGLSNLNHRGHIQLRHSPINSMANGESKKAPQPVLRQGEFSVRNQIAPSVIEHVIGDFTNLTQSHPSHTLREKSRVSSEISESETDATMSSPASDHVGSYCVTNNKLNVVTKL